MENIALQQCIVPTCVPWVPAMRFKREEIREIGSCLPLHLNLSSRIESIFRFCALFGDSHLAPDVSMGCAWRYAFSHRRLQSQINGFLAKCLRRTGRNFFEIGFCFHRSRLVSFRFAFQPFPTDFVYARYIATRFVTDESQVLTNSTSRDRMCDFEICVCDFENYSKLANATILSSFTFIIKHFHQNVLSSFFFVLSFRFKQILIAIIEIFQTCNYSSPNKKKIW